jgi:hypothetical protein
MGDQGYARIQGRKADGRRDDYTKLFLILVSLHERKRQRVIPTEGGRSHLLAFLAGQTPLFCRYHKSGDWLVWDGAPFLPRLVIIALMFIPRKVSRPNDVTRRFPSTRSARLDWSESFRSTRKYASFDQIRGRCDIRTAGILFSHSLSSILNAGKGDGDATRTFRRNAKKWPVNAGGRDKASVG